jgi:hypothetical protein
MVARCFLIRSRKEMLILAPVGHNKPDGADEVNRVGIGRVLSDGG